MAQSSAAEALPAGLLVGSRYRVERLLGRGGMGDVYAVRDLTEQRLVALKQLARSPSPTSAALFEREYHTLAGLRHPHIVEVYDYGTDPRGPYYTMELLEGSDLSLQAPMGWREACAYLRDVASLLGVLHARRLVHRDLSPANMWRTRDGRLKLLDFGTLASFGPSTEVVGTPAFVAPEVLSGSVLDQRTDLYALGALGYWLLTGVHAFPARRLDDLPRLWLRMPAPPSELLQIGDACSDGIPADLDALITSLLRRDPEERPSSTVALIDRLNATAGLAPEAHEIAAQGYLASKAFVGRGREVELMTSLLKEAREGAGRSLLFKGQSGSGRTRLLAELRILAQIGGAAIVSIDSSDEESVHGSLAALARGLLGSVPQAERELSLEQRAVVASLVPELFPPSALQTRTADTTSIDVLTRLQTIVGEWLLRIASARLIVLFADDLQELAEPTQMFLAALARSSRSCKLLVVATLCREPERERSAAVASFSRAAVRQVLEPLTAEETHALLRSVFGQVPYLERLSERIRAAAQGSPGRTLELAQHLVASGTARYADGMWTLPAELSPAQLPPSPERDAATRIAQLSPPVRRLAQLLSVPHEGPLSRAAGPQLSGLAPAEAERALDQLLDAGVLREGERGLVFADQTVQRALYEELATDERLSAHRRLAELELSTARPPGGPAALLRACLHVLHAGDKKRALSLLREACRNMATGELGSIAECVLLVERCVGRLREQGVAERDLVVPYAALACGSYSVHRRYAGLYGERALALLEQALRVKLMRRLRPVIGARLALFVALLLTGAALLFRRSTVPSLALLVRWFVATVASLASTASACVDPDSCARYAAALEPFTALGKNHAAAFLHQFCLALVAQGRDRLTELTRGHRQLIARLESEQAIVGMPRPLVAQYHAGLTFSLGLGEGRRDGTEVLRLADRLEPLGGFYAMGADYLRANYYAHQGDPRQAEHFRQRLELHAIRLGSIWQVETWAPSEASRLALRTNDAVLMKRAADELELLAADIPTLTVHARYARGAYLVLRGKYEEALPVLACDEEPLAITGWSRRRGVLARAYRLAGRPERAREVCAEALSLISEEDLTFAAANLNLQIESALADLALGHHGEARQRLDTLIAFHERYRGPLTMGALHEARAFVALADCDLPMCQRHLQAMESWYRPTGIPTLIELVDALRRRFELATQLAETGSASELLDQDSQVVDRVKVLLAKGGSSREERAQKALQLALLLSRAELGFIVLPRSRERPIAQLGARAVPLEVVAWAHERMKASSLDESTQIDLAPGAASDDNTCRRGSDHFTFVPLWTEREYEGVTAGLVLGGAQRPPRPPAIAVLMAMADRLAKS